MNFIHTKVPLPLLGVSESISDMLTLMKPDESFFSNSKLDLGGWGKNCPGIIFVTFRRELLKLTVNSKLYKFSTIEMFTLMLKVSPTSFAMYMGGVIKSWVSTGFPYVIALEKLTVATIRISKKLNRNPLIKR